MNRYLCIYASIIFSICFRLFRRIQSLVLPGFFHSYIVLIELWWYQCHNDISTVHIPTFQPPISLITSLNRDLMIFCKKMYFLPNCKSNQIDEFIIYNLIFKLQVIPLVYYLYIHMYIYVCIHKFFDFPTLKCLFFHKMCVLQAILLMHFPWMLPTQHFQHCQFFIHMCMHVLCMSNRQQLRSQPRKKVSSATHCSPEGIKCDIINNCPTDWLATFIIIIIIIYHIITLTLTYKFKFTLQLHFIFSVGDSCRQTTNNKFDCRMTILLFLQRLLYLRAV